MRVRAVQVSGLLADAWASYRESVVPAEAGEVQVQECRRAFYAGARAVEAMFSAMVDMPDSEGAEAIAALIGELEGFVDGVRRGTR